MPRQIVAIAVIFKRTEESSWEPGVYIGRHENDEEQGFIVDMDGQLPEVVNFEEQFFRGCAFFREEPNV